MRRRRWVEIEANAGLENLSTSPRLLTAAEWPTGGRVPTFTYAFGQVDDGMTVCSTTALSTGATFAVVVMEREEPNGPPTARLRYYDHAVVRVQSSVDARVRFFQTALDKDLDEFPFEHHEAERPACLQELIRRSTST
jgi:hypothetical protein